MRKYDYMVHCENLINNLSYSGWKTKLIHNFKKDPCFIMASKNKELIMIKIPLTQKDQDVDYLFSMAVKFKSIAYLYNPNNKKLIKQEASL